MRETRANPQKKHCPCCSGLPYKTCCQPFHNGKLPENALKLMRSRFAAYALNLPKYIIETTHPKNPQFSTDRTAWKQSISEFSRSSIFSQLKIADFKEQGDCATVVFTAYIYQNNQDCTFTEKSFFEKLDHKWLYRKGTLINS